MLVARFKLSTADMRPTLAYEWDFPGPAFSGTGVVHTRPDVSAGYVDYYFAVHLTNTCADWNRFAGLLLPDNQADRFEGFYEIQAPEELGGLFEMSIPENAEAFLPAQGLLIPWPWNFPDTHAPGSPLYHFQEDGPIKQLLNGGDYDAAIAESRVMLERRPDSVQFTTLLVEALLLKNDTDAAFQLIDELLAIYPGDYALYARLERCFEHVGGQPVRYANWQRLAATGDECARIYMEHARQQCVEEDGEK